MAKRAQLQAYTHPMTKDIQLFVLMAPKQLIRGSCKSCTGKGGVKYEDHEYRREGASESVIIVGTPWSKNRSIGHFSFTNDTSKFTFIGIPISQLALFFNEISARSPLTVTRT